jgi:hypothetical protein
MGSVCMKWTGELDCLKKFIECFVVGEGKWRSPGGSTKQFLSLDTDLTIIWYAHKQNSLTFNGEVGDLLREKLIQLCVDRDLSPLNSPNYSTESLISDGLNQTKTSNNYTIIIKAWIYIA